jgi:hypothetical protein
MNQQSKRTLASLGSGGSGGNVFQKFGLLRLTLVFQSACLGEESAEIGELWGAGF